MASTVECQVEADVIELRCHTCGASGSASSLTGDVMDRVRSFARSHRAPHVVRVHFIASATRAPLGWMTA